MQGSKSHRQIQSHVWLAITALKWTIQQPVADYQGVNQIYSLKSHKDYNYIPVLSKYEQNLY